MNHLFVLLGAALAVGVAVLGGVLLYIRGFRLRKPLFLHGDQDVSEPYDLAAIDQYLYDRCCRYMVERRPFLVERFRLQDLAGALYTNKSYLSRTINRFSGKNFRQYVNYYRIMYSMELYRSNPGLRVADMSSLSGFKSQSVFQRAFKQVMGVCPSVWCAQTRNNSIHKP